EDAPAHRHARLPRVTGLAPRLAEHADLLRLLHVQRLAGLVELQGRALEVHAQARRPGRRGVRRRAPPDALPEALRVRLEPQQAGRVREHRPRVRLGEALALEQREEDLGVPAGHVGVGLALARLIAEVSPAVDHLLRRATADA